MYYFTLDFITSKTIHVVVPEMRTQYKLLYNAVLPLYSVYDREVKDTRNIRLDICDVEGEAFDIHIINDTVSLVEAARGLQRKVKLMRDTLLDEY